MFNLFFLVIAFIGVTLGNEIIQVAGAQLTVYHVHTGELSDGFPKRLHFPVWPGCASTPVSPHPHPHLLLFVLGLSRSRGCDVVSHWVWICIQRMAKGVGHLFVWLSSICVSSLEKYVFILFARCWFWTILLIILTYWADFTRKPSCPWLLCVCVEGEFFEYQFKFSTCYQYIQIFIFLLTHVGN